MSQFPIIIKPSLLEQALTATPKPEPYQPPVIPSPGAKPKRFKTGLLVAQAVVFTIIALVPAFFGEFILEPGKLPLVRHGQKDWELEQEMHLRYVALTRAKQELYFIQPV